MIYLDNNATTRLAPEVLTAMRPWLEESYGNPSAGYRFGREARKAIDHAREQVGVQAMDQLRHAALHKDGQSVALVLREQPFKGFAIEDALSSGRGRTDAVTALQSPAPSWSRAESGAYAR